MKIRLTVIVFCLLLMSVIIIFVDSFNHSRSDNPSKADVIIVVGGDNGRMQKAADLYLNGYSDFVLISPVVDSLSWQSVNFAIELGIPVTSIIRDYQATSTYTNAIHSFEIMEEYNFKSALIVTNDYHLKRTRMIFNRMNNLSYDLFFISALNEDGKHWYERNNAKILWYKEFYKFWGYLFGMYKYIDY